jgi:hypothetical protein
MHFEAKIVALDEALGKNFASMKEVAIYAFERAEPGPSYRIQIRASARTTGVMALLRTLECHAVNGILEPFEDDAVVVEKTEERAGFQPTDMDPTVFPFIGFRGVEGEREQTPIYELQDPGFGRRVMVVGPSFDPISKLRRDIEKKIRDKKQVVEKLPNIFAYRPLIFRPSPSVLSDSTRGVFVELGCEDLAGVLFQFPAYLGDPSLAGVRYEYLMVDNPSARTPLAAETIAVMNGDDRIVWHTASHT